MSKSNDTTASVKKSMSSGDVSAIIRALLTTPIKSGPVISLTESDLSLIEFGKANTTVMERAIAQIGAQAVKGDVKSFEVLMKYGGYQPAEERHVTIDQPIFLNNVSETDESTISTTDIAIIDDVPDEDED